MTFFTYASLMYHREGSVGQTIAAARTCSSPQTCSCPHSSPQFLSTSKLNKLWIASSKSADLSQPTKKKVVFTYFCVQGCFFSWESNQISWEPNQKTLFFWFFKRAHLSYSWTSSVAYGNNRSVHFSRPILWRETAHILPYIMYEGDLC